MPPGQFAEVEHAVSDDGKVVQRWMTGHPCAEPGQAYFRARGFSTGDGTSIWARPKQTGQSARSGAAQSAMPGTARLNAGAVGHHLATYATCREQIA
jgi:hypothetical protein